MAWKPKVGETVYVTKFRTMPAFIGVVEEKVGSGWNVRHPDGSLWFRVFDEIKPHSKETQG